MDENHLSQTIAEILVTTLNPMECKIYKNYAHKILSNNRQGRKPEVDYVISNYAKTESTIAIEVKWANSSHCTGENVLTDLLRLKAIRESDENCKCFFVLSGHRENVERFFSGGVINDQESSPLSTTSHRVKNFCLDLDSGKAKEAVEEFNIKHPSCTLTGKLKSKLSCATLSANPSSRFFTYVWEIE